MVKNAIQAVVSHDIMAMATEKKTTAIGRNAGLLDSLARPFGSDLGFLPPFIWLRLLR